jgi:hypothetical protein
MASGHGCPLPLDFQEGHLEDQGLVGRNGTTRTLLAVAESRWESRVPTRRRPSSFEAKGGRSETRGVTTVHSAFYRRRRLARHVRWHPRVDQDGLEQQYALQEAARNPRILAAVRLHNSAKSDTRW